MTSRGAKIVRRGDRRIAWLIIAITLASISWPAMTGASVLLTLWLGPEDWVYSLFPSLGVAGAVVGTIGAASIIAVFLVRPPHSRVSTRLAAVLGAFAGAAPVSVVVFFLLQRSTCVNINVFGMPWHPLLESVGQAVTLVVLCGALVLFVACLIVPGTRFASWAVLGWWLTSLVPSYLLYALSFYGDRVEPCLLS